MTKEDFAKLVKAMKAIYAEPKFIADKDAFDVWYAVIGDLDFHEAMEAFMAHINTSPYPPMPVNFRQYIAKKHSPELPNEEAAWALVTKAIRNGYYGAEEEFAKLPPDIQRAVGSPTNLRELAQLPKETVQSVEKSNFMRVYRMEKQRSEDESLKPDHLKLTREDRELLEGE